jgi:hypothetical protein
MSVVTFDFDTFLRTQGFGLSYRAGQIPEAGSEAARQAEVLAEAYFSWKLRGTLDGLSALLEARAERKDREPLSSTEVLELVRAEAEDGTAWLELV